MRKISALTLTTEDLSSLGFVDSNLKTCIKDKFNENTSSINSSSIEIGLSRLEGLTCEDISDTSGISYLVGLERLKLTGNLTSIDLSELRSLKALYLSGNRLTNIDLSKNVNLGILELQNNKLSSIDLSKNVNLEILNLKNNKLSSIDLSRNERLNTVLLEGNYFKISKTLEKSATYSFVNSIIISNNMTVTDLSYSSDNTKVAIVDSNGLIKVLGTNGTATITKTYKWLNKTYKETNIVTVLNSKVIVNNSTKQDSKTNTDIKNPNTGDKTIIFGIIGLSLIGVILLSKKKLDILK